MGNRLKLIFFVAFFAVQGLYPLWAVVADDHVTSTDFTWDMFAVRRDCSECDVYYAVAGGQKQRISWGLRSPALTPIDPAGAAWWNAPDLDSAQVRAYEQFELGGRGALLAHPSMPALNVRAAPQVARLKSRNRLERVGADVCHDLEVLFEDSLAGESVPDWARRDAGVWFRSGRQLSVTATCSCAYNNAPDIALVDPEQNLCAGGAR